MAVISPVIAPDPSVPPERRSRARLFLAVAAVVAVALVAAVAWWLRHDTALVAYDGNVRGNARGAIAGHVGTTSYVPLGVVDHQRYLPDGTPLADNSTGPALDVRSVEPAIVDTGDASVAVMVCNVDPVPARWMTPQATSNVPLGCLSVSPFTPGKLDLNPNAHRLMVAVTQQKPGTFTMDGAYVDYRDGIRSGHQRVGERIRVTANPQ